MRSELPAGWRTATIGDLTVNLDRHRVPLSEAQRSARPGPYPYWGANGPIDAIDDYLFEGAHILLAEDGNTVVRPNGRATVHWATDRFWVNNHAHVLQAADRVDLRWLYFALTEVEVRPFVTGSAQPKLNQANLNVVPLRTPPPSEQHGIAWLLGALDDKIDSNRCLAADTEALATTLFDARFLKFSGVEQWTDTQIGPIPKGWAAKPFSEAVEINPKVGVAKGEDRPFIEMAAVSPWAVRPSRLSSRAANGGCRFEPGDTLMARITGCIENGKGAFIDFLDYAGTGSTEFFVLRARSPLTPETVFLYSRSERLRAHAIANMAGTSGRQRVVRACFDDFLIAVPPGAGSCRAATDVFATTFRQSLALWRENRTLARTRDALLPKLISGEIRVPDSADPDEIIGPAAEATATAAA